jgi:hypothetical protein
VLTLTVPVHQEEAVEVVPPADAEEGEGKIVDTKAGEAEEEETPRQAPQPPKPKPVDHGRWVSEQEGERLVVGREEVERAVAEARRAQEQRMATGGVEEAKGQGRTPARQQQQEQEAEVEEGWDASAGFHAAGAFRGRREGFVFKTGPQGLGYYREAEPEGKAESKGGEAAGEPPAVPPYRYAQLEKVVSVIVAVADVDPATMRVDWGGADGRRVRPAADADTDTQ